MLVWWCIFTIGRWCNSQECIWIRKLSTKEKLIRTTVEEESAIVPSIFAGEASSPSFVSFCLSRAVLLNKPFLHIDCHSFDSMPIFLLSLSLSSPPVFLHSLRAAEKRNILIDDGLPWDCALKTAAGIPLQLSCYKLQSWANESCRVPRFANLK